MNSRAEFPVDHEATEDANHRSIGAKIDSAPKAPVLVDGALTHITTPRNTEWKVEVM